ncbi:MAG TPA: type II toxin-antitoxin system prevent-host-death family antitoxin [Terriglobales bacterium]|nr:type II toxin-antitoxin system prevent-host-death family antitoxin [Terriglobales bacterium]
MKTVNIHQAKTHLSRLVEEAVSGEPFIIAKAGKPMVQVTKLEAQPELPRFGFLRGTIKVPDDFNTWMQDEHHLHVRRRG